MQPENSNSLATPQHPGRKDRALATVSDAASYLALSRSKVYSLMDQGRLAYVKIDSSRRIPWEELAAFVARCRVN